jgi:hypothetical protein
MKGKRHNPEGLIRLHAPSWQSAGMKISAGRNAGISDAKNAGISDLPLKVLSYHRNGFCFLFFASW